LRSSLREFIEGGQYARIETGGKEIRRSLVTTDRDLAKRRLAKLHVSGLGPKGQMRLGWGDSGELKPNPSWQEKLVMILRTVTSAQDFNHEGWGANSTEPAWVKKTQELYRDIKPFRRRVLLQ
jgi:hypothetical protein